MTDPGLERRQPCQDTRRGIGDVDLGVKAVAVVKNSEISARRVADAESVGNIGSGDGVKGHFSVLRSWEYCNLEEGQMRYVEGLSDTRESVNCHYLHLPTRGGVLGL